jgi:hypothetical protein
MINILFDKLVCLFSDTTIFTFSAYLGSGILLIQFIFSLFGADSEDFNEGDVGEAKKFKYLSLQTIGGFLMMFGWSAITCQKEFNLQIPFSIFLSLLVGLCSVFIINLIFKIAKKFHSPGNTCRLDDVIGKEALVYQRIPKDGVGKISISFQHLSCEIDAISHTREELPSFTRVQILKKKDDVTVVVMPV